MQLTLSSIYTRFNALKKTASGKRCGKWKNCSNEQFHLFPLFFLCKLNILKSLNSHISVVLCSLFEFGSVSKWCITECVKTIGKYGGYTYKTQIISVA